MSTSTHIGLAGMLALALVGCKPDKPEPLTPMPVTPTGTLRITMIPEWQGQPLQTFTEYRDHLDHRCTVEEAKLYWGEVKLGRDGDTLLAKDVELFNLNNGPVSRSWTVPTGTWSGLRAGLGVPPDLNYADPAAYASGHPLNVSNGTYWTWATGYRFVLFEGRYDSDPSSTATLINSYAIHPGMDPSYIHFELRPTNGITVQKDEVTELVIRVAVDRFLISDEYSIDLATENTAHGNNLPLQWKLVNNVVRSMTLE